MNISLLLSLSCFPLKTFQHYFWTDRHFSEYSKKEEMSTGYTFRIYQELQMTTIFMMGRLKAFYGLCDWKWDINHDSPCYYPSLFQHVQDQHRQK